MSHVNLVDSINTISTFIELFLNYENYNYFPEPFSSHFINEYYLGNIENCKIHLHECSEYITKEEKMDTYCLLFSYMNKYDKYDYDFIMYVDKYISLKDILLEDPLNKYKLFILSFKCDKLFKKILYLVTDWKNIYIYDNLDMNLNINLNSLSNIHSVDYLTLVIKNGTKMQLMWFLDWIIYNDSIQKFYEFNRSYRNIDYIKYSYLLGKYDTAHILIKYGFENDYTEYKYNFCDIHDKYKVLRLYGNNIYIKDKYLNDMSYDEFYMMIDKFICSKYEHFYLLTDQYSVLPSETCFHWNIELLYQINYPKKVIIQALYDLCNKNNHNYCCQYDTILKECDFVMKKIKMEIVYQVYIIYKHKMHLKKNKEARLLKKVFERFYNRHIFSKSDNKECNICLEYFTDLDKDKKVIMLNCNHYYHLDCLNIWKKENNSCPYCRNHIYKIYYMN